MTNLLKASLLSLWLGAAVFFSAVVAPSVFGVLHRFEVANANEIAGSIVTRSLSVINVTGFVIGLVLLAAALFFTRTRTLTFVIQTLALAVITVATGIGHWVVAARMLALRTAMEVPIDRVSINDARRIAFNQLHGYSVALLSAAMLAAIIAIILFGVRLRAASPNH